ncbi:MAG: sulfotransferase [Ideonella sp.]|nr:sulfotransferase [Ideonella sp.]
MWRQLTRDPRIALGLERYAELLKSEGLQPSLFEEDRFFDLRPRDTFYRDLEAFNPYYGEVRARYADSEIRGDKIPSLFAHLDEILAVFPEARVIVMVRNIFDIAASYERRADEGVHWPDNRRTNAAIKDWRRMLSAVSMYAEDRRVLPVIYEDFYFGQGNLRALYDFLELDLTHRVEVAFRRTLERGAAREEARSRDLSQEAVMNICLNAPFGQYRELVERIRSRPVAA